MCVYDMIAISELPKQKFCVVPHTGWFEGTGQTEYIGCGVALIFKQHLKVKEVSIPDEFKTYELLSCDFRLNFKNYPLIFCYTYRSPSLDFDDSILVFNAINFLSNQNLVNSWRFQFTYCYFSK